MEDSHWICLMQAVNGLVFRGDLLLVTMNRRNEHIGYIWLCDTKKNNNFPLTLAPGGGRRHFNFIFAVELNSEAGGAGFDLSTLIHENRYRLSGQYCPADH